MKKQIQFKLDSKGEFDEVFIPNAQVHIERMSATTFWIGIEGKSLPSLMVNTGVKHGKWFFNLSEDAIGGRSLAVERKIIAGRTAEHNETKA